MSLFTEEKLARVYYHVKPFLSRRMQIMIRGAVARYKRRLCRDTWPIDPDAGRRPPGFPGWPGGKRFAVVLTHDVDTARGVARCEELMQLERELGFRSSFNFVARDYHLPPELRQKLVDEGFEIGVHGLEHNRKLYESAETFAEQAKEINRYLGEWGAVGFRSPCVYHNFEWLHALNISYEASAFDTDPFEPQPDGMGTIFPVQQRGIPGREYVVLPYTLPQDFTLFILFREYDIRVWKEKLRWVADHGGMVLLISHPDYMSFGGAPSYDEYPPELYRELLTHIANEYRGEYWHALPHEVAAFWKGCGAGNLQEEPAAPQSSEQQAKMAEYPQPALAGAEAGGGGEAVRVGTFPGSEAGRSAVPATGGGADGIAHRREGGDSRLPGSDFRE